VASKNRRVARIQQWAASYGHSIFPPHQLTDAWAAGWVYHLIDQQHNGYKDIRQFIVAADDANRASSTPPQPARIKPEPAQLTLEPLTKHALQVAQLSATDTFGTKTMTPLSWSDIRALLLPPALLQTRWYGLPAITDLNHTWSLSTLPARPALCLYMLCNLFGAARPSDIRRLCRSTDPSTRRCGVRFELLLNGTKPTPIICIYGGKYKAPRMLTERPIPAINGLGFNAADLFTLAFNNLPAGNDTDPLCPSQSNVKLHLRPIEEHEIVSIMHARLGQREHLGFYSIRKTIPTLYSNRLHINDDSVADLGHWGGKPTVRRVPSTYNPVDNIRRLETHIDAAEAANNRTQF
jgi:hypothetical protein